MAKHRTVNGDEALKDNPVYQEDMTALAALIPKDFVQMDIGFPPYWKPDVAKGFKGRVLMRDERDPSFVRYHIENLGPPLDCQSGPASDGVVITVNTGNIFTIGDYKALPLDRFFGFEIVCIVEGSRKLPGNAQSKNVPRDLWEWKLYASKQTEAIINSQRAEDMAFMKDVQRQAQRKALEEITRINAAQRMAYDLQISKQRSEARLEAMAEA